MHSRPLCHVLLSYWLGDLPYQTVHGMCWTCIHNRSIAQVEWYLPDRRITPADEHDIAAAAKHLITHTSLQAGRQIEFSEEARDMFDSYQVMFNTRCAKFRKSQDPDAAAEEGTTDVLP